MDKTFVAVEDRPGAAWQRRFVTAWPLVKPWYLEEGLAVRPTPAEARAALGAHMPELLPVYETLCALAGPDEEAAWGCLDGMNEEGLVVSLTAAGSTGPSPGSRAFRCRWPRTSPCSPGPGDFATIFVGADRQPMVTRWPVCTNHQETIGWPAHAAASRTVERHARLAERFAADTTLDALLARMLQPPLDALDAERSFATVYTAVYRPVDAVAHYLWPGHERRQTFDHGEPEAYTHVYGVPGRAHGPLAV
jgi:predicted choloylglycine hydrolase